MNLYFRKALRPLMWAAVILSLPLGAAKVAAQPGPPFGGFGGMDPQQIKQEIQKRVVSFFREQLAVANDEEWNVIEARLMKVVQLKAQDLIGGAMGGGGGFFGGRGGDNNPMAQAVRSLLGLDDSSSETDGLRRAVEAKASNAELKAAVAKVQDARKRKQAEITKAQDDLRQVLTFRQEATLALLGMLN